MSVRTTAVWLCLGAALGLGLSLDRGRANATDPAPPNIVLVLLDDFASSDLAYLPRLRAFTSEQGQTFRMIVTSPRCAPSRASILTGMYAHNHGVQGNGPGPGGWRHLRHLEPTLVNCWLTSRGYATHYTGKYINGYGRPPTHVPPCWTDWQALTNPSGDQRYTFAINSNGVIERHTAQYQTDVLAEKTARFIQGASAPFFAVVAPFVPHTPLVPAVAYRDSLASLRIEHPPSFNEADVSDKWMPHPSLTASEIAALEGRIRTRLEMMRSVEDAVETIWDAVRARGQAANTYLLVTSDNGYLNGEHRIMMGKGVPYREATEVPLIVRGPGIAPGSTSKRLVASHDLAPTISDLAGAQTPASVDGTSILPLLSGNTIPWRRRVLIEHWNRQRGLVWNGVRSERGVIIKWTDGPWESYDHTSDPYEMNAGSLENRELLEALATCKGRECRRLEGMRSLEVRRIPQRPGVCALPVRSWIVSGSERACTALVLYLG